MHLHCVFQELVHHAGPLVCVYIKHTNERIIEEGGTRGKGNKRSLLTTYQQVVLCFLLASAPESPLTTGWLSKCQCQEISQDQSMITVRELDSEGEVCARKDYLPC